MLHYTTLRTHIEEREEEREEEERVHPLPKRVVDGAIGHTRPVVTEIALIKGSVVGLSLHTSIDTRARQSHTHAHAASTGTGAERSAVVPMEGIAGGSVILHRHDQARLGRGLTQAAVHEEGAKQHRSGSDDDRDEER